MIIESNSFTKHLMMLFINSLIIMFVLIITEILLKNVSCYGFVQEYNTTVTLAWKSKLVSHYPSKGFLMLAQKSQPI